MNNADRLRVRLRSTFSNCHVFFYYLHSSLHAIALGTTISQQACSAMHVINRLPYNQSCWCQLDRNCHQPMLLMTPRITPRIRPKEKLETNRRESD